MHVAELAAVVAPAPPLFSMASVLGEGTGGDEPCFVFCRVASIVAAALLPCGRRASVRAAGLAAVAAPAPLFWIACIPIEAFWVDRPSFVWLYPSSLDPARLRRLKHKRCGQMVTSGVHRVQQTCFLVVAFLLMAPVYCCPALFAC